MEWINGQAFGRFLNLFRLLGTVPDVGQMADIYELKLIRNPTGDISSYRSLTIEERLELIWNYLQAIKDVYGGIE